MNVISKDQESLPTFCDDQFSKVSVKIALKRLAIAHEKICQYPYHPNTKNPYDEDYSQFDYNNTCLKDYWSKFHRLVFYFASRDVVKIITKANYSDRAIEAYFLEKIRIKHCLKRCEIHTDEFGQVTKTYIPVRHLNSFVESTDLVLYRDEKLTNTVLEYVKHEEALFYSLLERDVKVSLILREYKEWVIVGIILTIACAIFFCKFLRAS